ncbi:hypothetical protein [Streptomyces xantholiticus]
MPGLTELKKLPHDEREAAVEHLAEVEDTPFASEDGERSKFFEAISFGIWG